MGDKSLNKTQALMLLNHRFLFQKVFVVNHVARIPLDICAFECMHLWCTVVVFSVTILNNKKMSRN